MTKPLQPTAASSKLLWREALDIECPKTTFPSQSQKGSIPFWALHDLMRSPQLCHPKVSARDAGRVSLELVAQGGLRASRRRTGAAQRSRGFGQENPPAVLRFGGGFEEKPEMTKQATPAPFFLVLRGPFWFLKSVGVGETFFPPHVQGSFFSQKPRPERTKQIR